MFNDPDSAVASQISHTQKGWLDVELVIRPRAAVTDQIS